jgi:hypothetical protein
VLVCPFAVSVCGAAKTVLWPLSCVPALSSAFVELLEQCSGRSCVPALSSAFVELLEQCSGRTCVPALSSAFV